MCSLLAGVKEFDSLGEEIAPCPLNCRTKRRFQNKPAGPITGKIARKWVLGEETKREIGVFCMGMAIKVVFAENLPATSRRSGNCRVTTANLDIFLWHM